MLLHSTSTTAPTDSETYPLGEQNEHPDSGFELALVALSHTTIEHRLYCAMLFAGRDDASKSEFTARKLMALTSITSASTVRRGLEGLVIKLSVERINGNGNSRRDHPASYRVHTPAEIIERRRHNGNRVDDHLGSVVSRRHAFNRAIARVAENVALSRREAQVTLCCAEGLTNAQIGERLDVSEQTVKFHLRHIFVKFGVKRRAELISRLLT